MLARRDSAPVNLGVIEQLKGFGRLESCWSAGYLRLLSKRQSLHSQTLRPDILHRDDFARMIMGMSDSVEMQERCDSDKE